LIGKALSKELIKKGYDVIILTRHQAKPDDSSRLKYAKWNVEKQEIDKTAISAADFIVHLAGANVAEGRWTAKRKRKF
jgi:NAD dependent epimerase/dehydratase family enzyme